MIFSRILSGILSEFPLIFSLHPLIEYLLIPWGVLQESRQNHLTDCLRAPQRFSLKFAQIAATDFLRNPSGILSETNRRFSKNTTDDFLTIASGIPSKLHRENSQNTIGDPLRISSGIFLESHRYSLRIPSGILLESWKKFSQNPERFSQNPERFSHNPERNSPRILREFLSENPSGVLFEDPLRIPSGIL